MRGVAAALSLGIAALAPVVAGSEPRPGRPETAWLGFERGGGSALEDTELALPPEREQELRAAGFGYVELLRRTRLAIAGDGTLDERITLARRYLTDEGVRSAGNLEIGVRADVESLVVSEAYALLADGSRRDVAPERVQVVPAASPDVFSDARRVVVPYEGLAPGSVAVLAVRRRHRAPEWPLPWSKISFPQDVVPIERYELAWEWEEGVEVPAWHSDGAGLVCEREARRRRCTARQVPAVDMDPDVASWPDVLPQVVVAEPRGWRDLIEAELGLIRAALAPSPKLDSLARRLSGSSPSERALDRIHRFVADEVRYVAFEHGASAVAPRPAADTLERGYGDCKDKVVLFLALAERAGLRAHPVLVAVDRFDPRRAVLPSWQYFDHMIACVRDTAGRREVCVDPTTSSAATGELPPRLYGALALDLREESVVPRTLASPEFVWDIDVSMRNELSCDGKIHEELVREFRGPAAVWARDLLRPMTPDERRRWAREGYEEVMGNRVTPELELSGAERAGEPVRIASSAVFTTSGPLSGQTEYSERDAWLEHHAAWFRTGNRHHAYRSAGVRITSRVAYRLCPPSRPSFWGSSLDLRSEFGSLQRSYARTDPNSLVVTTSLELPRRAIEPGELDRFRRFLDEALRQTRIWFALSSEPTGAGGSP